MLPVALLVGAGFALSACSLIPGVGETKLDPLKTPLSEYTSAMYGEQDDDFYTKQSQEVENMVAECMNDQGFEYTPVDQTQYSNFDDFDWQERQTKEWVIANGYGVNLTEEQQQEQEDQWDDFEDPNADYTASLSESESAAYWEALYGPQPTEEEMNDDGSYEYNWEDGGCYGLADHEVRGDQTYDQDQFKPIFDAMNKLYEDQSKDPRIKKLDAAWASCMADAGYPDFKAKWDAANSIYEQQNEFWENNPDGEAPSKEQVAEWREVELDTALADFTCGEEVDYTQKQLEVQYELEEQFIKDHKAELDALVAYSEKNKK